MIPPPPTCYALWQTKGCLILLSLSIVFLSVLLSLLLFSIAPSSQIAKKKEKSPHSLWIGQEVVRGLLLSALPLACAWHLGFFVLPSTSRQKRNTTQPKQIKPRLSQSACLSHRCSISASPRSKRKKRITRLFVCVIIAPFSSPYSVHTSFFQGCQNMCSRPNPSPYQPNDKLGQAANSLIPFHTRSKRKDRGGDGSQRKL